MTVLATTTVTTRSVVEFKDMRQAIACCDPFQMRVPIWHPDCPMRLWMTRNEMLMEANMRAAGTVPISSINRWLTSDSLSKTLERQREDEKGCDGGKFGDE